MSICLRWGIFLLINLGIAIQKILTMVVGQVQGLLLLGSGIVLLLSIEWSVESDIGIVNARVLLLDSIEGGKDLVVQVGSSQFGGIVFILIGR